MKYRKKTLDKLKKGTSLLNLSKTDCFWMTILAKLSNVEMDLTKTPCDDQRIWIQIQSLKDLDHLNFWSSPV